MELPEKHELTLKVKDLSKIQDLYRPHPTDAAFDVRSNEDVCIGAGDWALIGTGLYLDVPPGFEIQVRPRSGIAFKKGVTVLNSPGTIDEHYVDECKVILINHSKDLFYVNREDRIAQFVLSAVPRYNIEFVETIYNTFPEFQKHFFTVSSKLSQFVESQIAIEIMLMMVEEGINPLTIHDAYLFPKERFEELSEKAIKIFSRYAS
jgi:dUTP pyrophosphatase